MKKLRFGVVGVSSRGRDVMGEVIGRECFELCAVCDKDKNALEGAIQFFKEKGVSDLSAYSDYDEMLKNADIDAVFVSTDAVCHVPFAVKALEAGKHVLSEIPAINTAEEASVLKDAVKKHPHLKYMIAENCCYWGFIQAWKTFAEQGKFGEAVYAESEYLHAKDFRAYRKEECETEHWRNYLSPIRYLTHNLGPLLYILEDECVSVSAMLPDAKYNPYAKIPKNAVAIFKTKKGTVIRILISFGSFVNLDHKFRILGTRGTIETDNIKNVKEAHSFARFSDIEGSREKKIEIPIKVSSYGENGIHGGADRKMVLDFIDIVLNNKKVVLDVDFAINISLPGIVAAESAQKGGELMQIPKI
ncbi:MAG: Gfo/Idh/MocA family oxidoreductase [Clostridia bacterium]|nr:Gfo/Idh/MocA family oxidoreductase [Clostridia bacterium]